MAALYRCEHTGLTIPECSCAHCLHALLERHAPGLCSGAAGNPSRIPDAGAPRAQRRAPLLARVEPWLSPLVLMALIFLASAQPDLNTGLGAPDVVARKIVHVAEYALLCLLWFRALHGRLAWFPACGLAFSIAIGYACTDEFHQHFVHGRHAAPLDVVIDAAGALAAIALIRYGFGRRGWTYTRSLLVVRRQHPGR